MKRFAALLLSAAACLSLWGCGPKIPAASSQGGGAVSARPSVSGEVSVLPDGSDAESQSGGASIPFEEGQLYAVAYLGYQDQSELYKYRQYLDRPDLPTHYVSDGDFYLIIPRYPDMEVNLLRNDIQTGESDLFYHSLICEPFILQCNASDIFCDVTVRLHWGESETEFSPFISLKDGTLEVGDWGLNLSPELGEPEP